MTKVAKSALFPNRELSYAVDTDFAAYELRYPLRKVKKCHYEVMATKLNNYPHLSYMIEATLSLEDSRDAVIFDKETRIEEEVDILDSEDDEGEGYIVEGSSIDLDEICLSIIESSLPIKVLREDSSLPKSGKGYNILSEDGFLSKEKEEEKSSPFDCLKDLDL